MIRLLLTLVLLLQAAILHAWDSTGHAIVAMLAEERLTPTARAEAAELLMGQSLVEVAS